MANIIDGKAISKLVREEIAAEVVKFKEKYNSAPGLAVIIVGNDPASQVYVRNKKKGKSICSCGCSCGGCSMNGICHDKKDT